MGGTGVLEVCVACSMSPWTGDAPEYNGESHDGFDIAIKTTKNFRQTAEIKEIKPNGCLVSVFRRNPKLAVVILR